MTHQSNSASFSGKNIMLEFQNKRKIFEGFHSFGRKKFLFDEILNTNLVFPEIWGKNFFS